MMYLWLKSAHILAVIIWMAGMLTTPVLLRAVGDVSPEQRQRIRAAFNRVVSPAMILTLALGVTIAQLGGWFTDGWMAAKLLLVIVMTGIHGAMAGRLRRWASDPTVELPGWFLNVHLYIAALIALIVLLVVRKTIF